MCLAENIYFEARAESFSGKAAVANVTRNRVEDARWPSTYCEVVTEGSLENHGKLEVKMFRFRKSLLVQKHKCPSSWYCDGKKDVIWANQITVKRSQGNARAWRESTK